MSANECSNGVAQDTRGMEFKRPNPVKDEKEKIMTKKKTLDFTTGTSKMVNEKEIHT